MRVDYYASGETVSMPFDGQKKCMKCLRTRELIRTRIGHALVVLASKIAPKLIVKITMDGIQDRYVVLDRTRLHG